MSRPPQQPRYRAVVINALGEDVEFESFTSLMYSYYLNRGATAELVCPMNYSKLDVYTTAPRKARLKIYRRDNTGEDERLVWYGYLYQVPYSGNENEATMTLRFENIANILYRRFVPSDYSVMSLTDQSDIIWDLISYTQGLTGGDLGIIRGLHPVSEDRMPEKELQNISIRAVLDSYSRIINGLDWDFTPTPKLPSINVFNTYYQGASARYHKGTVVGVPLVYWREHNLTNRINNCSDFSIVEDGDAFANDVRLLGSTLGESQLEATATDASSVGQYGLYQDLGSSTSVSDQSRLDDQAQEELLAKNLVPKDINLTLLPHVDPRVGTYDVGDIFEVQFKYYQAREFIEQFRLYGMTVRVDDTGVENVNLELNVIWVKTNPTQVFQAWSATYSKGLMNFRVVIGAAGIVLYHSPISVSLLN